MKKQGEHMPAILPEIVAHKRAEIAERRARLPYSRLEMQVRPCDGKFLSALAGERLHLIAEIKPSSPSGGVLRPELNIDAVVHVYDKYASAISILTDKKYFNGSLSLLATVAEKTRRPILCKDFVLDRYQVCEARLSGAHAVLLIVKILPDAVLYELHQAILELGMTPLVEVQTEDEVRRVLPLAPRAVLINNRDLSTFAIDLNTTCRLAALLPSNTTVISASGIHNHAQIRKLLPHCSRFLIGSALMQADDMEATLKELSGLC